VVNYSFVSEKELAAAGEKVKPIVLMNPLSADQAAMRTTQHVGLLQNVARNLRHQVSSVRIYEIGRVYLPDPRGGEGTRPPAREVPTLSGALYGRRDERGWSGGKDMMVDFYDAKGAVEAVLASAGIGEAKWAPVEAARYHPRASAEVTVGRDRVGTVGEIHPRVAKAFDVPAGTYLFELDLEKVNALARLFPAFKPLARFPAVLRDLAVVVPVELAHEEVRQVIVEVGKPLVEDAIVFDVYTGKPIPEGKKNVAYALRYRAPDRTLTDAEVAEAHQRIVSEVNKRLGASLR
jgi:phenylalanyl-tRNA synthetase beta chain